MLHSDRINPPRCLVLANSALKQRNALVGCHLDHSMARAKKHIFRLRAEKRRLTWTRFRLPSTLTWPEWSSVHSNPHIGPLSGVSGCLKVLLGRQVEDPEQAAWIIGKQCALLAGTTTHALDNQCGRLQRLWKHSKPPLPPTNYWKTCIVRCRDRRCTNF